MPDMPVTGEVQMNLANTNCVGQDELCKNESHDNIDHKIFCVTGKDLELVNIDDLC